ncbi:TPA: hypothetical protein IF933_004739 [Escherichia coli]|nr:hypothetical protein [Escherichia coli]HAN8174301.1 hypothetical protein [Escherichia coli]
MTTITRESAEIKSFITGFLSDSAHDNQSSNSLLANVFRIALASLEAEPVAWSVGNAITRDHEKAQKIAGDTGFSIIPLYTVAKDAQSVTNHWMPEVGEYCEVCTDDSEIEWLKIKVVAIHGDEVAAIVCDPDDYYYDRLKLLGWEYDNSVFRPLSEGDVENNLISAENTLR